MAEDGTVSGYTDVTPLESGDDQRLTAVRTAAATPQGEDRSKEYNYIVSYEQGEQVGSTRSDTVINVREGGLAMRLFKWDSTIPLKDGRFTLEDSSGKTLGTYTSGADGTITMFYAFEYGEVYTLAETAAPTGYVGLQKKLRFRVNTDDTVTLLEEDGTTPWSDTDWSNAKPGANGIIAYVDVYNKPFNLKVIKTDSDDPELRLGSAHFALYKQSNTTISGYVKNKDPMTGFEDLVTVNGEVDICGGNSGRVINPGAKGSVYFLTEKKAPFNYKPLENDIVFRISPLGVPSLISTDYDETIENMGDYYVYTISVPNEKKDTQLELLTIEKRVGGSFGDKSKEFEFTLTVTGAGEGDGFIWAKNGEQQLADMDRTGGTFTMRHNDKIEIALPKGVEVTLTEDSGEYTVSMSLDGDGTVSGSTAEFSFTGSRTVVVTNTLNGVIPTGIASAAAKALMLTFLPAIPIGCILYSKRRRRRSEG